MNDPAISRKVNMRHLRSFVAVAKHRNLTRAAESLFVTQSALSLTINHLEDDLGVSLFNRSTRRIELTSAGIDFLPDAERLVHEFDRSIRQMQALGSVARGVVGIAAVPSAMALLLPLAVAQYMDAYPGVDIYLREDNSEFVQRRVLDGDVDFGVCSLWESDSDLCFEPIFEDDFGVVFSTHHPLVAHQPDIDWRDIAGYQIIGFSPDLGMQHQLSKTAILSEELREPRYRVSNTSTIEALLAQTLCISVMSALAAKRAPLDQLIFRRLTGPTLSRKVGIVTRQGRRPSPAAETMLSHVRNSVLSLARFEGVTVLLDS
jgi:DNA-binding transcriptional LysR family regulator